jgi:hypothetical protein
MIGLGLAWLGLHSHFKGWGWQHGASGSFEWHYSWGLVFIGCPGLLLVIIGFIGLIVIGDEANNSLSFSIFVMVICIIACIEYFNWSNQRGIQKENQNRRKKKEKLADTYLSLPPEQQAQLRAQLLQQFIKQKAQSYIASGMDTEEIYRRVCDQEEMDRELDRDLRSRML